MTATAPRRPLQLSRYILDGRTLTTRAVGERVALFESYAAPRDATERAW